MLKKNALSLINPNYLNKQINNGTTNLAPKSEPKGKETTNQISENKIKKDGDDRNYITLRKRSILREKL